MFARNRKQANREFGHTTAALVEAIEPRLMLSAGGSAALTEGVVVVQGTRRSDSIVVALDGADSAKLDVTVNGKQVGQFTLTDVMGVKVFGGNGNDRVTIQNTLDLPSTLVGGNGKDTLNGGAGDDMLEGDNGKDALSGGGGADALFGGRGNDRIAGGDGGDVLSGGKDADNLSGDAGDDTLTGGTGDDSLDGGDGNDEVMGDAGDDDLDGGAGTDDVHGGAGHNQFHSGDQKSEKKDKKSGDGDLLD